MDAVGANHDARPLDDRAAGRRSAADAADDAVVDDQRFQRERLADLRPTVCRGVEKQLVEDEAPGSVGNRGMGRPSGSTGDRELAEVNAVCLDRRAASRDDSVRQP